MKKSLPVLSFLISAFLLTSCAGGIEDEGFCESSRGETQDVSDAISSGTDSSEKSEEASEAVSSESEAFEPEVIFPDILPCIAEHGRTLNAYGELEGDEYAEPLARLAEILGGYDKSISLVVFSTDNSRAVSYNTESRIFPASMIKSAYSLYACKEMEKGNGSLDTLMVYESKHYETGTGDMQYSAFGTVFDMRTVISKTMSISDNVGYLMMNDYFGRDGYNEWISDIAPTLTINPTVWCLSSSALDWARLWREIYEYFEGGGEYAEFLCSVCTDTEGNFAAMSLPQAHYSHKQGHQRSGKWHSYSDAGIMWDGEDTYIFAILTDAPGPSQYEEKIFAEIMAIIDGELF